MNNNSNKKLNILFLCTANSCRSQMAEGLGNYYQSSIANFYSAGIKPSFVNSRAIEVMKEIGIDISKHTSKNIDTLDHINFDYVITVCDKARESCPIFPHKTKILHKSFEDPPELAKSAKNHEEELYFYRKIRDEIKEFILNLPKFLY